MDTKQQIIRWGIIGCGDVTEVKSGPAYQKTEGFELTAVMRRDAAKAEDYARRHTVKTFYTDADQLIAADDVDAVYIATPPDSHMDYALKTAAAGKPCCIEKPMAPHAAACREICTAFEERKLPLFTAYYRRTLPRFVKIKEWLDAGAVGTVRHVSWQLTQPPSALDLSGAYNWRTDAQIAPAGYFDDLASHGLDLLAFYLGDYKEVSGFSRNQQRLYTAKDAAAAVWMHESGVTGSGAWNFGAQTRMDRAEIIGSQGSIEFSVFEEAPIRLTSAQGGEELQIAHPGHVQQPHVEAMRDHLLHGIPHPSSGKTGAHTAWVMDRILGAV